MPVTYKKITIEEREFDAEEISEARLFNVFVFGVPRSGTSMMMGICEKLGVNMIHTSDNDKKLKERNETERKRYGDGYQMNMIW